MVAFVSELLLFLAIVFEVEKEQNHDYLVSILIFVLDAIGLLQSNTESFSELF